MEVDYLRQGCQHSEIVMKILSILLALLTTFGPVVGAPPTEIPIQDLLKQEWKTLQFGIEFDGGDYNAWGPFILLQRLDSDRIVFSAIESNRHPGALPVALAVVSPKEAAVLVSQLIPFVELAKAETGSKAKAMALPQAERMEVFKRAGGFGMSAEYLDIQIIAADGSRHYVHDDFGNDTTKAMNSFVEFLNKTINAKNQPPPKLPAAPTHPPR